LLIGHIRKGTIIAYRIGKDRDAVPAWPFHCDGGLFDGLPVVLRALRQRVPDSDNSAHSRYFFSPI